MKILIIRNDYERCVDFFNWFFLVFGDGNIIFGFVVLVIFVDLVVVFFCCSWSILEVKLLRLFMDERSRFRINFLSINRFVWFFIFFLGIWDFRYWEYMFLFLVGGIYFLYCCCIIKICFDFMGFFVF